MLETNPLLSTLSTCLHHCFTLNLFCYSQIFKKISALFPYILRSYVTSFSSVFSTLLSRWQSCRHVEQNRSGHIDPQQSRVSGWCPNERAAPSPHCGSLGPSPTPDHHPELWHHSGHGSRPISEGRRGHQGNIAVARRGEIGQYNAAQNHSFLNSHLQHKQISDEDVDMTLSPLYFMFPKTGSHSNKSVLIQCSVHPADTLLNPRGHIGNSPGPWLESYRWPLNCWAGRFS